MKPAVYITEDELLSSAFPSGCGFPAPVSILPGEKESAYAGDGDGFTGLHEYRSGDTFRHINRYATARTGKIHVNEYAEDRMLSLLVLADQSSGMFTGSRDRMRSVVAARISAGLLLGYAKAGHRTGGEVFNAGRHSSLPLTVSMTLCREWIRELAAFNLSLTALAPDAARQDGIPVMERPVEGNGLESALERCLAQNPRHCEIYVVSDLFCCTGDAEEMLSSLCRYNRVGFISLSTPADENPVCGVWLAGDGGYICPDKVETEAFLKARKEIRAKFRAMAEENGIGLTELSV